MRVAKYWARVEGMARNPAGEQYDLVKWGWSDKSATEAEARGRSQVEELAARVAAGEGFPDHYHYGEAGPLCEELVRTLGTRGGDDEAAITRNCYGALVLNTARVMFVDIDLADEKRQASQTAGGALARLVRGLFGSASGAPTTASGEAANPTPAEQAALDRVRGWIAGNRDWHFRAYRTAAGLRLMATHALFDPKDPEVTAVMKTLGADPLYIRLCRAQECFRARLTPKPWRLGMEWLNIKKYLGKNDREKAAMLNWVSRYDRARANAATCQLLTTIGSGQTVPAVAEIMRVHDEETRVASAATMRLA